MFPAVISGDLKDVTGALTEGFDCLQRQISPLGPANDPKAESACNLDPP